MKQISIETIQKNTDSILQKVGKQSFVNWTLFKESNTQISRAIDQLTSTLNVFREIQHKTFIPTMKKLKSFDIPDLLQNVKSKKLPKEALKGVLSRFTIKDDNIELVEQKQKLKESALIELNDYIKKNKEYIEILNSCTQNMNKKIKESGEDIIKIMEQKKNEELLLHSTKKINLNQDLAIKIASQIKIQYIPGTQLLSFQTFKNIINQTYQLIKSQFEKLTNQSRKQQRSLLKNHKSYQKAMIQYIINCQSLFAEGKKLLALKLGVSIDQFLRSEQALINRGYGNSLMLIQSQLHSKTKQSISQKKEVSLQLAKQILKYQIQLIEKNVDQFKSILSGIDFNPQTLQIIPNLLALILADHIYQKYGLEQEDYLVKLGQQNGTDPQFIKMFSDMEYGIMKLMQQLDIFPPQVREMMKQQQLAMEQMGIHPGLAAMGLNAGQGNIMGMPGGMGPMPGGMGPSSNPMDMLQMQQFQQMQSMFSQMGLQPPQ